MSQNFEDLFQRSQGLDIHTHAELQAWARQELVITYLGEECLMLQSQCSFYHAAAQGGPPLCAHHAEPPHERNQHSHTT